jgi:hypothetical protein
MTRPNPSRARAAFFTAAALILVTSCGAAALAQSGRKGQKPLGLPTEKPKAADPADRPAEQKKVEPIVTFVVLKDDTPSVGYESMARDGVAAAFLRRLEQAGETIAVRDGGRGRRPEARDRAKKEETAYVVFFQLEETGMSDPTNMDVRGVVLRTYVYTPKAADLKYHDTVYQRPYQDSARVGGVRVPVPTRRIERYPSQLQLEQAARDAADRLLSRFHVTPPPEQ